MFVVFMDVAGQLAGITMFVSRCGCLRITDIMFAAVVGVTG